MKHLLPIEWQKLFIQKATQIHNNKYNYDLVNYVKSSIKVKIVCPTHGIFEQRSNDHLNGNGCPVCKFEKIASLKRKTIEQFIKQSNVIHNNKYDYSKVKYVNAITKVEIICPTHGSFLTTPDKHITSGIECTKCSEGISKNELKICNHLDKLQINYEREKRFPALREKL